MKRRMITTALAACLTASLTACGGGGGNAGSGNTPLTPPVSSSGNLDAYVGTWTSACASHAIDTAVIARAAGSSNALTIAVTTNYYANTACTGDIIATQVWSAATTATYVGTVASSIMPGSVAASIDKMTAQQPQRSVTLTGTFVSRKIVDGQPNWCIDYAGGSVCVPDRIYAAEPAPFDGLAIVGGELVEVKSNGVNYDAVERFTKR
ncbi:hypothetical protein NX786_16915 [Telluria mixta]|uniref:APCDD1 domain-containing protein n=1 Tax=Telluria mixta TaxID=34071 RepID=A0ABT2C0V7_9BURK|nr:hypothetical protein [Telluria mixta]MCS0631016.1 hypothetical protein [Telluria mixta]WEM95562.1 hypothetical protein P0M04_29500 [Telluria mixta]